MNDQHWYEAAAHDPDHPLHLAAAAAATAAGEEAERAAWEAGREASQEQDQWEQDREYLADPTQPEYYQAYERQYGEPAPDWPSITGPHPLPEFEAGV
jgi:hypothetical protein